MNEHVERWLDIARWAPSGGNIQPWRVSVSDFKVRIFLDPGYIAEPSPMDKNGVASVIALGAFALTLECAAMIDGYRAAETKLHQGSSLWTGHVELRFEPGAEKPRFTKKQLCERETNRVRFSQAEIDPLIMRQIREIFNRTKGIHAVELTAKSIPSKFELFKPLATLEKIRWQNVEMLDGMLDEINFGAEERSRTVGIPSSQLGVNAFDSAFLAFIKKIKNLRIAFRIGFENLAVQKALGVMVRHCGALFILQSDVRESGSDFDSCFQLGRAFQEAWVVANSAGLSFQPIGIPLVGLAYWRQESNMSYSAKQIRQIENRTLDLAERFRLNLKQPMLGFRIGVAAENPGKSRVRTLRKTVGEFVETAELGQGPESR